MSDFDEQSFQAFINDLQSGALSYDQAKSRYRELGDAIRHRYEREVTALAVDIVQSGGAKGGDPLDGQLTFDAYHHWVEDALKHFGCDGSFTWSGDGLLAVFDHPHPAAAAGRHLLDSLPMFNARYNRTARPLQIRIGVHTGPILTDEAGGIGKIASLTFDVAGHLQKAAAPNQMLVSETAYSHLGPAASDLLPIPPEVAGTGPCFAYPPHITLMGAPALAAPALQPAPSLPAPTQSTFVPWLLAVAGLAVAAGVLIAVTVLWPRNSTPADPGTGAPAVAFRQEPVGANQPAAPPTAGASPGNAPAANAPTLIAAAPPAGAPEPGLTVPPAPKVPPAWEPSRLVWTSADSRSGVPPRLLPSPPERKWLLAIGVGEYQDNALSAPGAGADARLVAAAIQQSAEVPLNHVHVLTDGQATFAAIKQAFKWLQQSATSGNDTLYLYLAGAAMLAPDRADLHHAGGSGYALFPTDARLDQVSDAAIYGADVAAWLGATRAQTIVLIVDSNHAGAFDTPDAPDAGRELALLTSTGGLQRARETTGQRAGFFAELLAGGLQGAADSNRDGRVALSELKAYLDPQVARATLGAQTPDLRGGFGGNRTPPDVLFVVPRR